MVCLFLILINSLCEFVCFPAYQTAPCLRFHASGAAGLPSVSLADGPGGPRGALYRGLPPPAALLDARMVCEIHLHPYHSP